MLIIVETGLGTNSVSGSLARGRPLGNVLHLLPELLELGFQFHDLMSNRRIVRLGAHGIGLSTHFLKQEIQSATGEAVTSIDEIGKIIKQLEETSTAIAAAMEEQGATTQDVARNVSEAASGTRQVSENIAGLTKTSQETGAAARQVTSSAEHLSSQAEALKREVGKFITQVRAS